MRFIPSSSFVGSRHSVPRKSVAAFTLLEILVVLGIIGLIAGLAVSSISGIFNSKKEDIARMFVTTSLKTALFSYSSDLGDYPSTAEGLQALLTAPSGKAGSWRRPYLDSPNGKVPVDPWQQEYKYAYPGIKNKDKATPYDLWSTGPDKIDGTADDIGNWAPATESDSQK